MAERSLLDIACDWCCRWSGRLLSRWVAHPSAFALPPPRNAVLVTAGEQHCPAIDTFLLPPLTQLQRFAAERFRVRCYQGGQMHAGGASALSLPQLHFQSHFTAAGAAGHNHCLLVQVTQRHVAVPLAAQPRPPASGFLASGSAALPPCLTSCCAAAVPQRFSFIACVVNAQLNTARDRLGAARVAALYRAPAEAAAGTVHLAPIMLETNARTGQHTG